MCDYPGCDIITAKWLDPQLRNSLLLVINLTVSLFCVEGGGVHPRLSTTDLTQTGKILLDENGVERDTEKNLSQSYQTLISLFFRFRLLSLAILKYRQYFIMPHTLELNNKKRKRIFVLRRKNLVRLTPAVLYLS